MKVFLCGVRGSTAAPGPAFVRYGGHTSCVAVAHDGAHPSLVLDGGTGLRRLSDVLNGEPFQGTMLLGHLHWDHIQGVPFFTAGDRPDARVALHLPRQEGDRRRDAFAVLAQAMSPPFFPIGPRELRGDWSFGAISEGAHSFEGFEIRAVEIPHKGGRTFGYRVSDGSGSMAYLSDHSPIQLGPGPDGLGAYHPAALELAAGVNLLIHDGQHTAAEFGARRSLGHSAVEYAVGLASAAGAGHLMLFHHDPTRTDDEIDAIVDGCRGGATSVSAAAEGMVVSLPVPDHNAGGLAHARA
ncbi:MAG: MBL fold metallo-hydrolase [Acidimicrobiales bacterium]